MDDFRELLRENYGGRLEKKMIGPIYLMLVNILQVLIKKKPITPGGFVGATGNSFIACVQRQVQGLLYPLSDGFLAVSVPFDLD